MNGIVLGLITSVFYILMYCVVVFLATTFPVIFAAGFIFKFLLPVTVSAYMAYKLRGQVGGYWNLRQAVTGIFIMLAVAYVTNYIITEGLLGKLIIPGKNKAISAKTTRIYTDYIQQAADVDPKDKDKRIAEIKAGNNSEIPFTLTVFLAYTAQLIIILFVFSLALAAIFKRDPPVYRSVEAGPTA